MKNSAVFRILSSALIAIQILNSSTFAFAGVNEATPHSLNSTARSQLREIYESLAIIDLSSLYGKTLLDAALDSPHYERPETRKIISALYDWMKGQAGKSETPSQDFPLLGSIEEKTTLLIQQQDLLFEAHFLKNRERSPIPLVLFQASLVWAFFASPYSPLYGTGITDDGFFFYLLSSVFVASCTTLGVQVIQVCRDAQKVQELGRTDQCVAYRVEQLNLEMDKQLDQYKLNTGIVFLREILQKIQQQAQLR